jgi:four helix bundle protein
MKHKSEILYERLYKFAFKCQQLTVNLSKTSSNTVYTHQLLRSSGSIGANYIEALEALSRKDFIHRLRISRKETRESIHWLKLLYDTNNFEKTRLGINELTNDAEEFRKIFTSSILTLEKGEKE